MDIKEMRLYKQMVEVYAHEDRRAHGTIINTFDAIYDEFIADLHPHFKGDAVIKETALTMCYCYYAKLADLNDFNNVWAFALKFIAKYPTDHNWEEERENKSGADWDEILEKFWDDRNKEYYLMDNIGSAKYTISTHDGKQTHKDGSKFFGIEIFSNKKKVKARVKELIADGYNER